MRAQQLVFGEVLEVIFLEVIQRFEPELLELVAPRVAQDRLRLVKCG